ncbi:glycerol-3-phosphate 1-O-acyltransferase PlsY [Desulfosporosinus sp.]|uniref:glycerol-3-phosphate 1-O-acyltransferase PlsY n=1 Tax=Desulfosporosinus sp. TaxID=157907 RepID=UPI00231C8076|nr:glycerol-3-phosphate 1-O-acyltransferase PlsY [Desulfosporosinus sp.]MCO5387878.1 glycerol-3-phosphate 1-O-acyltransferase PlsY [Desulfosporosinus sp.]MDA8223223.1 glycerol-3-phosphate 1-O-acyltransferase PlsY [Desulfitobacterium hafniense]
MSRYLIYILAYCLGAIPFAYLAGLFKGIDVRQHGSGNIGTTNAFRLLGVKLGIMVLLGDFMKGALSAYLGLWAFGPWGGIIGGLLAMASHSWNPFFGFRPSGKGVAAGFGIVTILMWKVTLIAISVFILVVWLTRYVSMGSVTGALTVLIMVFVFPEPFEYRVFAVVAVLAVLVLHRANIQRVLNGTEHRFGDKK